MLEKLEKLSGLIGNTRTKEIDFNDAQLFVKLEYLNNSGSIKDRAAFHIMKEAILSGKVNEQTTVIESSSGNFAIALATICRAIDIPFIPVVDPNINEMNLELIKMLTDHQEMVTEIDETGGYLLTRIQRVEELCQLYENSFWPNQYTNPENPKAYELTLCPEIINEFEDLDYIFIAVSSGGTLMGLSNGLKNHYKNLKIIAVDIEGSVIFQDTPKKRYVSGLGASKIPEILDKEKVDDVIIVTHKEIIEGALELLKKDLIFGGASSGAAYFAAKKYITENKILNKKGLIICPDRGFSYQSTVFNSKWAKRFETSEKPLVNVS